MTVSPSRNSPLTTNRQYQVSDSLLSHGQCRFKQSPVYSYPFRQVLWVWGVQRMTEKVIVACEFSGIVRDAFRDKGFDAISCDLRETESNPEYHVKGDALELIDERSHEFDLMIAHPPCTYLANSASRWLYERDERWKDLIDGAVFFRELLEADIPHIAVENPVMYGYAKKVIGRSQDQCIQPWQFGHGETKRTCLWLKNLPLLEPTNVVEGREQRIHKMPPSDERSKERSRFYRGIAEAMADQWGSYIAEANANPIESQ